MANPDLPFGALAKPLPGSGRAARKQHRIAAKQGIEAETHEQTLARLEFWRVLRLDLFARDSGCCRACGRALNLDAGLAADAFHAHHLTHRSRGGQDVLANLISLCAKCHRKHHDGLLTIGGTVEALTFVARNLKGTIVKAWESILPVSR